MATNNSPRRGWGFSLFSLLLVFTVVCVGVSHVSLSQHNVKLLKKNQVLTEQVRELRSELGYLNIDDHQKVYFRYVGGKRYNWNWKRVVAHASSASTYRQVIIFDGKLRKKTTEGFTGTRVGQVHQSDGKPFDVYVYFNRTDVRERAQGLWKVRVAAQRYGGTETITNRRRLLYFPKKQKEQEATEAIELVCLTEDVAKRVKIKLRILKKTTRPGPMGPWIPADGKGFSGYSE